MSKLNYCNNPRSLPPGSGWNHVVYGNGTFIAISGQVSVNEQNEVVGKGDVEQQIRQVYKNLLSCLQAVGADFNSVIKINYYATDIKIALPIMRRVREELMDKTYNPANTFVEVTALAHPDFLFEAEAFAIL